MSDHVELIVGVLRVERDVGPSIAFADHDTADAILAALDAAGLVIVPKTPDREGN